MNSKDRCGTCSGGGLVPQPDAPVTRTHTSANPRSAAFVTAAGDAYPEQTFKDLSGLASPRQSVQPVSWAG